MPKFNPLTGQLDYTGVPVKSGQAAPPEFGPDGEILTEYVEAEGRIYFRAGGMLFYVTGIQTSFPVNIPQGQPIGLMGVTYAEDVT